MKKKPLLIFVLSVLILVIFNKVFLSTFTKTNAFFAKQSFVNSEVISSQKLFDKTWKIIAKEYYEEPCGDIRDYIDQIKECNNLDSSDRITEGCYLCVPVYTENVR